MTATAASTASSCAAVEATAVPVAPLYITIGPPCAGKTTWIRRKQQQQQQQHHHQDDQKEDSIALTTILHDVSIDDQDGVYVPVPTAWFFNTTTTTTGPAATTTTTTTAAAAARSLILHGKTAFDRIHKDQMELVTIISRLANHISRETCESQLKNAISTKEAANGILAAVEDYISAARPSSSSSCTSSDENTTRSGNHIQLPETIDLFVVEALFRPDPAGTITTTTTTTTTAATSAIERASQALRHHAVSDAIVWGNTNCRSTDYQDALQLAVQQGRPVYFIVYSENDNDDPDQDSTTSTSLHAKNLQELFQRSIARLVQTGRYVPANVIMDMRRRCLEMTTRIFHHHPQQQNGVTTGMELECHLARLAQFELDPVTRTVRPLPTKRRRSNDQQHQHQQRYHDHLYRNNPLQYRGGVHSTAVGLFQQTRRGGIMPGRNHQYGNYHTATTTTTNSHSREGQWARRRPDGNHVSDNLSNATTTATSSNPRRGQWEGRKNEDGRRDNPSDLRGKRMNPPGAWR